MAVPVTRKLEFEEELKGWCEREGIEWRHDIETGKHVFTRKPLNLVESALEECFGDTEFPKCTVSSHVVEAVKSLEVHITGLTDLITRRLRKREEHYG